MALDSNLRSVVLRPGLLMLAGAVLTAIDAALVKIIANELHPLQIYFFRCLVALSVLAGFILRGGIHLRTVDLPVHVIRAVLKLVGIVLLIYALTMLPIPTVTAISFMSPLMVSMGAVLWLGEKVQPRHLVGLLLGFCGVVVVARPTAGFESTGFIVAGCAALVSAAATLLMKYSSGREPASRIVALNLVISVPISLLAALPVWSWPSPALLGMLLLQGAAAAVCQLCYVTAHSLATATKLMPLDFLRLPAAIAIAYLVFAEMPDLWTIAGALLIFGAGAVNFYRRP